MKLTLENFRSHQKSSFAFPDVGFVKVSAASGTGKSNLFKSIIWGLYGGKGNVVRYGSSGCKVDVSIGDLSVSRSKGPALLSVNGMTGEAGQSHINGMLGMNELEFEISSYIAQDQANSFIHCKPAEQMELLQKLAFDKDNPEELKEKVKTLLKETEDKHTAAESTVSKIEIGLKHKSDQLTDTLNNTVEPSEAEMDVAELKRQKKALEDKVIRINDSIFADEGKVKNQSATRDKAQRATIWLEGALPTRDTLQKWFEENPEVKFEQKAELDNTRIQIQHLKGQLKEYNEMLKRIADRNGCERKVTTYKKQLWELIVNAHAAGEEGVVSFIGDLGDLAKKLDTAIKDLSAADNKGSYLDDPNDALTKSQEELVVLEQAEADWIALNAIRSQKKKEALELNVNIKKAEVAIEEAAALEPLETIQGQIEKNKEEKELTKNSVNDLSGQISRADAVNAQWVTYKKNMALIGRYQKEIGDLEKELATATWDLNALSARQGKLKRLLSLIQKAALSALDARIAEINVRAEHWLDVLFSGTLQATIETEKEQKNGNVSHKINLAIFENGTKIDKKEELSGGQQSRLALAFQLALSDMYRSPILCLDESLKGCDPDTSKICLEAIRQISERKLVLMVEHHVADSQFDDVVKI